MNIKTTPMAAVAFSAAIYAPFAHAQSDYTDIPYNTFWSGILQVTQTADAEEVLSLAGITYAVTPGGGSVQTSTYNTATGTGQTTWAQLLSDSAYSGGAVQTVTASSAAITYTRSGQSVTLKNFELDTQLGTVYADIYAREGSFLHQRWLVQDASSGTVGQPGAKPGNHSEGGYTGLVLDGNFGYNSYPSGTAGILSRGLGLTGAFKNVLAGVGFANVSYSADYLNGFYWPWELPPKASLVPEPSTYGLMAFGFASLMLVARRKRMTG